MSWRPASGPAPTAASFRATSSSALPRAGTAPRSYAWIFRRRSPPIRSCRSSRSRPKAARSVSAGRAMKASPSKSPSPLTLRDLLGRRAALVLLPAVFAASFALSQVGADQRRSDCQDMGAALQKMKDDDTANPGMLFVQLGQQIWAKPAGAANKACADCHSVADMKGVAARYPAMPKDGDKPIDLESRVRLCRTLNQQAEPVAPESRELLSLAAFVAN